MPVENDRLVDSSVDDICKVHGCLLVYLVHFKKQVTKEGTPERQQDYSLYTLSYHSFGPSFVCVCVCVWIQLCLLHCCNRAWFWPICYEFSEIFVHLWAFFSFKAAFPLEFENNLSLGWFSYIDFLHIHRVTSGKSLTPFSSVCLFEKYDSWLLKLLLFCEDVTFRTLWRWGQVISWEHERMNRFSFTILCLQISCIFERLIWMLLLLLPNSFWSFEALANGTLGQFP